MDKAKFIEEMMNFLPEDLTASQIKAVTHFCSNLFDRSSLVDMPNRLSKAKERVSELEDELSMLTLATGRESTWALGEKLLKKFAIEKKIEALKKVAYETSYDVVSDACNWEIEQLRKEQASE
jgi:hypothetical protein